MRSNPTETLRGWGLEKPESNQDISAVITGVMGAQALVAEVANQSQELGKDVWQALTRVDFVSLMIDQLDYLEGTLDETTAIQYLRNLFGEPQDGAEGALDVYMELASDQVNWQIKAKEAARQTHEQMRAKIDEFLMFVQSVLISKLAELQVEIEEREAVLDGAEKVTSLHTNELQPLLTEKRQPLDFKLQALKTKRTQLGETFSAVQQAMTNMTQGIEYHLNPVLDSSVGPTQLQPELAA